MTAKPYPCLWFDGIADEAARFYNEVFPGSSIRSQSPMSVVLESSGQKFMLLNGGPHFKLNPSISFYVLYEDPTALELAWKKLLNGGMALMPIDKYEWSEKYGWVQDKFGVNWQLSLKGQEAFQQKFTIALMFTGEQNGNARKALKYYTSFFPQSTVLGLFPYEEKDNETAGNIKHAQFILNETSFIAMDSSYPHGYSFNEAISIVVECDTQEEIDFYWDYLTRGGKESQCGWLKDRFGLSWQIVPSVLESLMSDPGKAPGVIQAFLKMKKFVISDLYK